MNKQFQKEYDELLNSGKEICVECLSKKFDKYIGDQEKYNEWMMANTLSAGQCEECGKSDVWILPYRDIRRAIRASNGEKVIWY